MHINRVLFKIHRSMIEANYISESDTESETLTESSCQSVSISPSSSVITLHSEFNPPES